MKLVNLAYESAKKDLEINWKEIPGGASNPLIMECYSAVDGLGNPEMLDDSKIAWCSAYVNKKIQSHGGKGTRSASARSWLRWSKSCKPTIGCITVLKRGTQAWQGHVGFLHKFDDTYVWILGGNQSNNVTISRFLRSDVLDFRTSKD